MGQKKKKIRVQLRKSGQKQPRRKNFRQLTDDPQNEQLGACGDERISGKGELTRHRTIIGVADDSAEGTVQRQIDLEQCLKGRVLSPRGAGCIVRADDGELYECTVRRLLKAMAGDNRNAVVAGDRVHFRPAGDKQGAIESVEPRHGTLSRMVKRQRHILVANVDRVLIVNSAADPQLKPSLVDRYLISAQLGNIRPIICINKVDLVDIVELQSIVGLYSQLGYDVVTTSIKTGFGIERLRHLLRGHETVLAGQSGVGKSSLINAVEPGMNLRTLSVSEESGKGRHTTTNASLLELSFGGWVVDTPGIRQLDLWDVIPEEVEGFFLEFHPFVSQCKFSNCSHLREAGCGIKKALRRGLISAIRYESYIKIRFGE